MILLCAVVAALGSAGLEENAADIVHKLPPVASADSAAVKLSGPAGSLLDSTINITALENGMVPLVRTATGGYVYNVLVMLTVAAFIGNAIFLVDSFWLPG